MTVIDLDNIWLLGRFKNMVSYICMALWLVVTIFVWLSISAEQSVRMSYKDQVVTVVLILISGVAFHFIFQNKYMTQLGVGEDENANDYKDIMLAYMSVISDHNTMTEKESSDRFTALGTEITTMLHSPDRKMDYLTKTLILKPLSKPDEGFPFLRVMKVMLNLFENPVTKELVDVLHAGKNKATMLKETGHKLKIAKRALPIVKSISDSYKNHDTHSIPELNMVNHAEKMMSFLEKKGATGSDKDLLLKTQPIIEETHRIVDHFAKIFYDTEFDKTKEVINGEDKLIKLKEIIEMKREWEEAYTQTASRGTEGVPIQKIIDDHPLCV